MLSEDGDDALRGFCELTDSDLWQNEAAGQEVLDESLPREPPVTILFAALGDRIAEDFDSSDVDVNRQMLSLIENTMESGDPALVAAVATGQLEAVAARAMRSEALWNWIVPFLGPRSRHHAEAWLGM